MLNLGTAISEARAEFTRSGGQRLRKIKLYSDAVTWTESTTFSFEADTRFTIWAREVSGTSSLKLKMEKRSKFYFHTTTLPVGFTVHAETSNGTKKDLLLVIPSGYLGACLSFSETDVEVDYREPGDEDFNATGYLDYLTPEGKLSEGYVEFNEYHPPPPPPPPFPPLCLSFFFKPMSDANVNSATCYVCCNSSSSLQLPI